MIYSGIFDTHAHYDDKQFNEDRDELLSSFFEKGVCGVINCGCDYRSSLNAIELSRKYDYFYAAIGVHPENITEDTENELRLIKELYGTGKVVAVGEIGLEYHYDFIPKETQLDVFEKQIKTALEFNLPVIVHDREAHEDTMRLLKKYKPKGVVHCFSGSVEMAKEVVKNGMYIGLGGAATFKNARKPLEVASYVPFDRLLLETDCPYMAPVPFRGKRNDSSLIAYTANVIAAVKATEPQELIDICRENAFRLFLNK